MIFESNNKKKRGQGIVKVADLFKKYRDVLRAPQGVVTDAFVDVVFEVLGVRIEKDQCTYSVANKTLSIRVPGVIKSEIKIQKKVILDQMAERLGGKSAPQEIL